MGSTPEPVSAIAIAIAIGAPIVVAAIGPAGETTATEGGVVSAVPPGSTTSARRGRRAEAPSREA